MKESIEKYVLANAVQHGGRASSKAVMNKVIGELGRKNISLQNLSQQINKIIEEVAELSDEDRKRKLQKLYPEFFAPKEIKAKELPELVGAVKNKVILRFEPSPSGPLHIGHVYPLLLNKLYKDKYNGKLILRLADTNPANIYPPAYKQILKNAEWVTNNNIDEVHVQSDRMKIYYNYAKELIASGFAYVCTCRNEKFKELALKKMTCPCRQMRSKEHIERWEDMFLRYLPGEAALRIKTDVTHKNPAIREWVAFRIVKEKHPRQGTNYQVWPTMNFCVAVDDHEMKLTHIIHGKEHHDNAEKQSYIFKYFRWKEPQHLYLGRINFKGLKISTSKFKQEINSKIYTGWDDIRLPTIFALQRRGIQPEALEKQVKEIGPTKTDKTVSFEDYMKTLYSFNKEIIDSISDRYYFVPVPVKLRLQEPPAKKSVHLKLHPDRDEHTREVKVNKTICIPKKDFLENKGKEIRLKGLYNVNLGKRIILNTVTAKFSGGLLKSNTPKIQWVSGRGIKTEILMPNGKIIRGLSEPAVEDLKKGKIIQFERFGFVRLDKKEKNKLIFVYTNS